MRMHSQLPAQNLDVHRLTDASRAVFIVSLKKIKIKRRRIRKANLLIKASHACRGCATVLLQLEKNSRWRQHLLSPHLPFLTSLFLACYCVDHPRLPARRVILDNIPLPVVPWPDWDDTNQFSWNSLVSAMLGTCFIILCNAATSTRGRRGPCPVLSCPGAGVGWDAAGDKAELTRQWYPMQKKCRDSWGGSGKFLAMNLCFYRAQLISSANKFTGSKVGHQTACSYSPYPMV